MNATEASIHEQFPFWRNAPMPSPLKVTDAIHVIIGCGTSYNLALSIAAMLCARGHAALAVPAGEWLHRPQFHVPPVHLSKVQVIALSRSGESTETVLAAEASRARGLPVTGITCAAGSALTRHSDTVHYAQTHAAEGIVMTASASLMLLLGFALAGLADPAVEAAEAALDAFAAIAPARLAGRRHFVFLGGGANYGVAVEGSLKLQEMSLSFTQAFHPFEYRHGPVSLVDEMTLVVLIYDPALLAEESKLAAELSAKGALVIGLGGPGDISLPIEGAPQWRPLTVLPALQIFGEMVARAKGLDTAAPRHLTKVVRLG
jgi:glutamine---fructose-6-phosphate transaminase (isomerizing)